MSAALPQHSRCTDPFVINADECLKLDAPLIAAGLTDCQRTAFRVLWEHGKGAEEIQYSSKSLARLSGLSADYFDEHLSAGYRTLEAIGMPLFKRTRKGLCVASTGFVRASVADTTLLRQIIDEIELETPVNPLARVRIAVNVLRGHGAKLPEPEPPATDEPGEPKRRRSLLDRIKDEVDELVTRAERDPKADEVSQLGYLHLYVGARLEERRKVREHRLDSGTGEIPVPETPPSDEGTIETPVPEPPAASETVESPVFRIPHDGSAGTGETPVPEAGDLEEITTSKQGTIKGKGERHEEAAQANVLFDSVGATEAFCVWLNDRDKLPRREVRVDLLEFERRIPEYQVYADGPNPSGGVLSFAYRPHGPNVMFVQNDDIRLKAALEAVKRFAFGGFETSPGSWQAWVAIAGVFSDAERTHLSKRFVAWLAQYDPSVNPGAHGSIRFPGFLNFKYSAPPMVRTIYSQPGLVWTVEALEAAGVLADLGPLPGGKPVAAGAAPPPLDGPLCSRPETLPDADRRGWPSYAIALRDAPRHPETHPERPGMVNRSSADMSFANIAAKRGWGWDALAARLAEVSENWRDRDEDYRHKTLTEAFGPWLS